eukprot:scaffold36879_cov99-Phaeocystis_antarctica.AAC.3
MGVGDQLAARLALADSSAGDSVRRRALGPRRVVGTAGRSGACCEGSGRSGRWGRKVGRPTSTRQIARLGLAPARGPRGAAPAALTYRHRYVDTHRSNGSQATVAPGRHVGCLQALGDRKAASAFLLKYLCRNLACAASAPALMMAPGLLGTGRSSFCLPAALGSTGGQARVKLHDDARKLVQRRLCR